MPSYPTNQVLTMAYPNTSPRLFFLLKKFISSNQLERKMNTKPEFENVDDASFFGRRVRISITEVMFEDDNPETGNKSHSFWILSQALAGVRTRRKPKKERRKAVTGFVKACRRTGSSARSARSTTIEINRCSPRCCRVSRAGRVFHGMPETCHGRSASCWLRRPRGWDRRKTRPKDRCTRRRW